MTTNFNLPLNSGSIMYNFGISLVFLSPIIRKMLSQVFLLNNIMRLLNNKFAWFLRT